MPAIRHQKSRYEFEHELMSKEGFLISTKQSAVDLQSEGTCVVM
jgi:hypothetical protein